MMCRYWITFLCLVLSWDESLTAASTTRYKLELHDLDPLHFGCPVDMCNASMHEVSKPLTEARPLLDGSHVFVEWYVHNLATEQFSVAVENSTIPCTNSYVLISEAVDTGEAFELRGDTRDVVQCGAMNQRATDPDSEGQDVVVKALRLSGGDDDVVLHTGGGMITRAKILVIRLVCTSYAAACPGGDITLTTKAESEWTTHMQCIHFPVVDMPPPRPSSEFKVYIPWQYENQTIQENLAPDSSYTHDILYDYQTLNGFHAACWSITYHERFEGMMVLQLLELELPCEIGHFTFAEDEHVHGQHNDNFWLRSTISPGVQYYQICGDGERNLLKGQKCYILGRTLAIGPHFTTTSGWKDVNFTLMIEIVNQTVSETDLVNCWTVPIPAEMPLWKPVVIGIFVTIAVVAVVVLLIVGCRYGATKWHEWWVQKQLETGEREQAEERAQERAGGHVYWFQRQGEPGTFEEIEMQ